MDSEFCFFFFLQSVIWSIFWSSRVRVQPGKLATVIIKSHKGELSAMLQGGRYQLFGKAWQCAQPEQWTVTVILIPTSSWKVHTHPSSLKGRFVKMYRDCTKESIVSFQVLTKTIRQLLVQNFSWVFCTEVKRRYVDYRRLKKNKNIKVMGQGFVTRLPGDKILKEDW